VEDLLAKERKKDKANQKADAKYERDEKKEAKDDMDQIRQTDFAAAKARMESRQKAVEQSKEINNLKGNNTKEVRHHLIRMQRMNMELTKEHVELEYKVRTAGQFHAMRNQIGKYRGTLSSIRHNIRRVTRNSSAAILRDADHIAATLGASLNTRTKLVAPEAPKKGYGIGNTATAQMQRLLTNYGSKLHSLSTTQDFTMSGAMDRETPPAPGNENPAQEAAGPQSSIQGLIDGATDGLDMGTADGLDIDDLSILPPSFDAAGDIGSFAPASFDDVGAATEKLKLRKTIDNYADTLQKVQGNIQQDLSPEVTAADDVSQQFANVYTKKLDQATMGPHRDDAALPSWHRDDAAATTLTVDGEAADMANMQQALDQLPRT